MFFRSMPISLFSEIINKRNSVFLHQLLLFSLILPSCRTTDFVFRTKYWSQMNSFPENETPLQHYRLFGRSGLRVSPLCLGTMTFGSKWAEFMGKVTKDDARNMFETYVKAGCVHLQTCRLFEHSKQKFENFICFCLSLCSIA